VGDTNDLADGTITYYLDGVRFGQMTTGERWGFDRRHAIGPLVRMYADGEGDNEVNTVYLNSLQFRDYTMTPEEAAALGPASANGIPIPATGNPTLAINRTGTTLTLSWNVAVAGSGFNLESTDSLTTANWSTVPNVVNNSVTVPIGAGNKFFRLKK